MAEDNVKAYVAAAVVSPHTLTHRNVNSSYGRRHTVKAYVASAVVSPHMVGGLA